MIDIDAERARFERCFSSAFYSTWPHEFSRDEYGNYKDKHKFDLFRGWLAAKRDATTNEVSHEPE